MSRGMGSSFKAAKDGNMVDLLSSVQGSEPLSSIRTPAGNSVLHVYLMYKERPLDTEYMKAIIDNDESLLSARNDNEENPLHTAASSGEVDAVKLFLGRGGGRYTTMVNKDGDTALHIACREAKFDVAKELLCDHWVAQDYVYNANNKGETLLHLAIENASSSADDDILRLVFQASVRGDPRLGCALHVGVSLRDEGIVKKIIDLDVDLIKFQDRYGQTPLHYAAVNCWLQGIELLLDHDLSAAYCKDKNGQTAAHFAAHGDNLEVLKLLVAYTPDLSEARDEKGRNVVHCAAESGSGDVLKHLLEDKHFSHLIDGKDKDGHTPFHVFANSIPLFKSKSVASMQRNDVIPLIQKRMMKNVFDNEDCTPGDIAAKHMKSLCAELEQSNQDLLRQFVAIAPTSNRNKNLQEREVRSSAVADEERRRKALTRKSRAKTNLNTSLAFTGITAGFLVQICSSGPGKFNQYDTDPINGGNSILVSEYSSQAFFIFILISFMVSVLSSICNAMVVFANGKGFWNVVGRYASILTLIISPVSLLMALMALLYATKRISGISMSIMGVTSVILVLVCCVIVAGVLRFRRERSNFFSNV